MKKIVLSLMLLLSACASKELSLKADLVNGAAPFNMDVSAAPIPEYSDDYNLLLQINLRSRDGRWVRVDTAEMEPASIDGTPFNVIVGKDLVAWAEAKGNEIKMDRYNSAMKLKGLAAVSGAAIVAGILTDSDALMAAGMAGSAGVAGYSAVTSMQQTRDLVQGVKPVPESHLYSPFAVPSMTLVKRWVLINAPTGRISKTVNLKIKTVEGDTMTYAIRLKE